MALVVFRSKAAGEIFMFAETARRILAIIGKDDAPRGVISAEQLADALERLTAAVEEEKAEVRRAREEAEQAQRRGEPAAEEGARAITLAQRAHPLLEMLRAAQKKRVDVTWGV
jgi:rubrerythrin